ncbi:hypothetical protein EXIGLDRAFT_651045 [Exidia glandulosa HHB12029]|uniref:Importin N-terminal domain-containing protein n=1 Tax=Exidia glandulosa HHB12029 TaxID=1314781 RepID=A0A165F8E3_EXIGL|nr:hypothetical protein EXIGLDRAFT_651045 [Exidia glandulosa HHB12029]
MEGILDFSTDLDVTLLDKVAIAFFSGAGQEQQNAQRVLTAFQEHPDAWQRVPQILQGSKVQQAKFIALQILAKLVETRWNALPQDQRLGIRNFIVGIIMELSADEAASRKEKTYLNKLNLCLVQILKQDWPHHWPTFIPELVQSSKTNLSLCENNMVILKLLSEEIFDYSAEQMTQAKIKSLKAQLCNEFSEVFQLCFEILEKAAKPSLIKATLETLLRFLNWIPLGYLFETSLIDMLVSRFLDVPEFRNVTLKCLSEIASLEVGPEYDGKFVALGSMVMTSINRTIPPSTNIADAYADSSDADQQLILNLALFLSNYLGHHLRALEASQGNNMLLVNAHMYMIKVSQVDEREIFKVCLEYWLKLVAELYEEVRSLPIGESGLLMGLSLGPATEGMPLRKTLYNDVLSNLRLIIIDHMVKPEEVLIVENDEGEIVREFMREIDTIVLYKSMRECLVYLTHLDVGDTETILTEKLARQVDGSEWSWNNINRLCWAIGSISGAMNEETEKRFLVLVIKELLGLTEMKRGKDNKAVVASNIMYIVGQYPRFLKAHWKFLKTVVNKLFEFMHESHDGVQDMACDTFIKIAQKCRRHFIIRQVGEAEPFIDEILRTLHRITADLSPLQVHTVYEAIGYMISAQPNKPTQEKLIQQLMTLPNNAWDAIMQQAATNPNILDSTDTVKILSNVLKTNVSACISIGPFFTPQYGKMFMDMLGLYKAVSQIISDTVARDGTIATNTPRIRGLRTIKKDILRLTETYIKKAENVEEVNSNLIPPLLEAVLLDYSRNVPSARDAEVLNVMVTITGKLGNMLTAQIPPILEAVFEPTLSMINRDFTEFPEHRTAFYKLLRVINVHCFPALLQIPPAQFKMMMDAIVWAFKHTTRDVADIGLNITVELIEAFAERDQETANQFFLSYLLSLLQDILYVLTDADHKSGFNLQTMILARLFRVVEGGIVTSSLAESAGADPSIPNSLFLKEFVANLLKNAFPHVAPSKIETFVLSFAQVQSDATYKTVARDFLIELKEFASTDNAELFREEKEQEAKERAEAERSHAMSVPGMLKPAQLQDQDEAI